MGGHDLAVGAAEDGVVIHTRTLLGVGMARHHLTFSRRRGAGIGTRNAFPARQVAFVLIVCDVAHSHIVFGLVHLHVNDLSLALFSAGTEPPSSGSFAPPRLFLACKGNRHSG